MTPIQQAGCTSKQSEYYLSVKSHSTYVSIEIPSSNASMGSTSSNTARKLLSSRLDIYD